MQKKLCAAPHVCAARKVADIFASEKNIVPDGGDWKNIRSNSQTSYRTARGCLLWAPFLPILTSK
jgi:hypothetical protein